MLNSSTRESLASSQLYSRRNKATGVGLRPSKDTKTLINSYSSSIIIMLLFEKVKYVGMLAVFCVVQAINKSATFTGDREKHLKPSTEHISPFLVNHFIL